jgi:hypothetical protein
VSAKNSTAHRKTVERRFEPDADACARALEVLLKRKHAAGTDGGRNDPKGAKHDRANSSLP